MSEYTTFYLRYKAAPMLEYKDYPLYEETTDLSETERKQLAHEINDFNYRVSDSWGSEVLTLSTTPSRQLCMPWAESPQVVTLDLLEGIMSFYEDNIDECHRYIDSYNKKILVLEGRFAKANPAIYDKISSEIEDCQDNIVCWNEDLEKYQSLYSKFEFLKEILKNLNEDYELIYTKC